MTSYNSRESYRPREMYRGHARLCDCLCVCLSAAACLHYCTDPDVTWGVVWDMPLVVHLGGFAIGARVALLWQHYRNAWQSPAVIRQAHRTPHALRIPAKTPSPAIKSTRLLRAPFYFVHTAGGVVTRTRNVSEYMVVLALCLVLKISDGEWPILISLILQHRN